MQPHRRQPTRLHHPGDSPGKNTGVGCHFLLQCMKVKSESEVIQSCPTLHNPMDCSPPGSFIHGIFQARGGVHSWQYKILHTPGVWPTNWKIIISQRFPHRNVVSEAYVRLPSLEVWHQSGGAAPRVFGFESQHSLITGTPRTLKHRNSILGGCKQGLM